MKNKFLIPLLGAALLIGSGASAFILAGVATADAASVTTSTTSGTHGTHTPPAAMGKVTGISGTTLTITDMKSSTTYTIDAANATVTKDRGVSETLSDIAVGDIIAVDGTVSGTTVTATSIHEGMGMMGGPGGFGGRGGGGVMGTVTAVNGTSLIVTAKDGGTYTVDASSATVKASGATSSVSSIKVGDTVMIQGTVTTASMTAKNIEDGVPTHPVSTSTTAPATQS